MDALKPPATIIVWHHNCEQAEFARFVLSESESAARIIKAAGIKP